MPSGNISKLTRMMKLVAMLRDKRYPNHRTLQRALRLLDSTCTFSISQKTIQRDVQFLQRVYHAPIGYDNGKRGYYLTDPTWRFEVPMLNPDDMQAVTLGARNEGGLFNFPTIDEVVLRFTGKAIPYARENFDPGLVKEQSDGSLLVTIYDAIDFKIINLVLDEGGEVTVVRPKELADKVIKKAKAVIAAQSLFNNEKH